MDIVIDTDVDNRPILAIVSLFEDYSLRGEEFLSYCLYDYCALVYKDRKGGGIPFE